MGFFVPDRLCEWNDFENVKFNQRLRQDGGVVRDARDGAPLPAERRTQDVATPVRVVHFVRLAVVPSRRVPFTHYTQTNKNHNQTLIDLNTLKQFKIWV